MDALLAKAREVALQLPDTASCDAILDLCATVDNLLSGQADMRREVFREAVRGIAGAIRNDQVPAAVPWSQELPGPYGSNELLAQEIERANAAGPITISELRQLRVKIKSVEQGNDEVDEIVKQVYYGRLFESNPSTESILPPGSPSRSIDIAALIVQRLLPNGWWTMGSNGENLSDAPVAKVGTWTGDNPKPESAPTPPLSLLAAMTLTLIETAKKEGGAA